MTQLYLSDRLAAVSLAAALLGAPAASSAQSDTGTTTTTNMTSGDINVAILTINGESQDSVGKKWINLGACVDDFDVVFDVDNVSDGNALDYYVGSDCNTAAQRDDEGDDCRFVGTTSIDGRTQDIRITIGAFDLVTKSLKAADCGSSRSDQKLWFLAVDTTGTSEAVAKASYGTVELNIDTDAPAAPTRIEGGTGENEIPVTWRVGTEEVDSFEIYVDSGNGGVVLRDAGITPPPNAGDDAGTDPGEGSGETNSECGTGALVAGGSPDEVSGLLAKRERSATATSTKLSRSDIDGDSAAVAVVAIDEAGNRSNLSEVACVMVVPTTGFKDQYVMDNGEIPQGCPCAATGPVHMEGALPIGLALGVLAYRRRRRS